MLRGMSPKRFNEWRAAYRVLELGEAESQREDLRQAIAAHAVCAASGIDIPIDALIPLRHGETKAESVMTSEQQAKFEQTRSKHAKSMAKARELAEKGFNSDEIQTVIEQMLK